MQAYSQDLRERVLRAIERGERPSEIARRFEVTRIWVYQVKERFEKQGERCSHPMGSKRLSKAAQAKDDLCAWSRCKNLSVKADYPEFAWRRPSFSEVVAKQNQGNRKA